MIRTEQIDGITKFSLARSIFGRGFYFTAAYLVDDTMIDTGCAYTVRELVARLHGHRVNHIVNTHSHEDHIAGNAVLQHLHGSDILAHHRALPILADPRGRLRLGLYQKFLWGSPDPSRAEPVGEFVDTERCRFTVINTPGHSPDHICLYEPRRGWLFTGDLFVGGQDRALRFDYNIWHIIASLQKVAALDISLLLPGSGRVRRNPRNEIIRKIEYLEELGQKVLRLHNQGLNYARIRRMILGPEMGIAYVTLGHFSGRNLIRSYIDDQPSASEPIP